MEPSGSGSNASWPAVATSPALLETVSSPSALPSLTPLFEWPHSERACHCPDDLPRPQIKGARVLMVGAGGIGCELLKTLVLTSFENITLVRSPAARHCCPCSACQLYDAAVQHLLTTARSCCAHDQGIYCVLASCNGSCTRWQV